MFEYSKCGKSCLYIGFEIISVQSVCYTGYVHIWAYKNHDTILTTMVYKSLNAQDLTDECVIQGQYIKGFKISTPKCVEFTYKC